MKTRNKALVLTLCAVLLVVATVMGTLAYLTDTTDEVKNTFTIGKVDIDLTEEAGKENNKQFKMVPGCTITKDPKVTVNAGSEDCIVFVKVEKSANFDAFLTYEVDVGNTAWTKLTGVTGVDNVYYRVVKNVTADQTFSVLKNDKVQVKDSVTSEKMNALTAANYPTLTFTAYACQLTNGTADFSAAEAWAKVNPTPAP